MTMKRMAGINYALLIALLSYWYQHARVRSTYNAILYRTESTQKYGSPQTNSYVISLPWPPAKISGESMGEEVLVNAQVFDLKRRYLKRAICMRCINPSRFSPIYPSNSRAAVVHQRSFARATIRSQPFPLIIWILKR